MKLCACLFVSLLLYGCTTTQGAMQRAASSFGGENIDAFVLTHGIPYRKYQLNNGDYVYVWNSGVISYKMPATTTITGTVTPYSYTGTATTYGGGSIDVFCEVQIHTKSDGTIMSIKAVRDTIGKWTTSRCSEIFE